MGAKRDSTVKLKRYDAAIASLDAFDKEGL